MMDLILPLLRVARVVVGVRPWPEFGPLRDSASTVIDLDDVPVAVLRADLAAYVDDLLRPVYRTAALRESRQVVAATIAEALTEPRTVASTFVDPVDPVDLVDLMRPPGSSLTRTDEDTRRGAFLVAGLYAHQLRNRPAITDPVEAERAGRAGARHAAGGVRA